MLDQAIAEERQAKATREVYQVAPVLEQSYDVGGPGALVSCPSVSFARILCPLVSCPSVSNEAVLCVVTGELDA